MRLPGRAWLQFEVTPCERGVHIRQTALFDPVGVTGLAYWYLLYPAHALIFRGMLRGVAARATGNGAGHRSSLTCGGVAGSRGRQRQIIGCCHVVWLMPT